VLLSSRVRGVSTFAAALLAPPSDVSRVPFVVRWFDLDTNLHLTNGRYGQLMDVGRIDLFTRCPPLRAAFRAGLRPLVVEQTLRFRRDLPWGARFVLESAVTGRDRKALVITQRFLWNDEERVVGVTKVVLRGKDGVVEPGVI
jgi:acyl-CoA thioesterase FadM